MKFLVGVNSVLIVGLVWLFENLGVDFEVFILTILIHMGGLLKLNDDPIIKVLFLSFVTDQLELIESWLIRLGEIDH